MGLPRGLAPQGRPDPLQPVPGLPRGHIGLAAAQRDDELVGVGGRVHLDLVEEPTALELALQPPLELEHLERAGGNCVLLDGSSQFVERGRVHVAMVLPREGAVQSPAQIHPFDG